MTQKQRISQPQALWFKIEATFCIVMMLCLLLCSSGNANTKKIDGDEQIIQGTRDDNGPPTKIIMAEKASDHANYKKSNNECPNKLHKIFSGRTMKEQAVSITHIDPGNFQGEEKMESQFDSYLHYNQYSSQERTDQTQAYPHGNLEEYYKLRRRDLSNSKQFPPEGTCPYQSIRVNDESQIQDEDITCRTSQLNDKECEFINGILGKPRQFSGKSCPGDISTKIKPLCWFRKDYRFSSEDTAGLQCSIIQCQPNPVHLGVFNVSLGNVLSDNYWPGFDTKEDLEHAIMNVMKMEYANNFRFCFLRCITDKHRSNISLKQMLTFPPILQSYPVTRRRINVNIVVEDSVSRAHFYRSLPKTVDALRDIVHDSSVSATVLDFEMYQSYDSSTHSNMQRLFTGRRYRNFDSMASGIKNLYGKYKKAGYRTMFQEDACWFDGFGSLLRPPILQGASKNNSWSQWTQLLNIFLDKRTDLVIDTFGVGFSACEILQHLGDTNIFNGERLPSLCFNGHHLSTYYLRTVEDFLILHNTQSPSAFSYVHLNSGHEHSGRRIINDDVHLARFLRNMANHSNTLTILMSDHGGKTSDYAIKTSQGLKEIFKPFLFMIIPQNVAEFLGNERMKNLISNQKRLIALEDLHSALVNLVENFDLNAKTNNVNRSERGYENAGLFSNISPKRNCSNLELSGDVLCQCEGEEVATKLDHMFLNFLGNVGIGEINNLIQFQYTKRRISEEQFIAKQFAGYGRCQRYVLKRVERVRNKVFGESKLSTFTTVVETVPENGREEIFEVTMSYPLTNVQYVNVIKVNRLSRYSVFKSCADVEVDLHLCTCDRNSSQTSKSSEYTWKLLSYYMFTHPSKIRKLHDSCLYLIITQRQRGLRNRLGQDATLVYQVINLCDHIFFIVTILDDSLVRKPFILSRPLPFEIYVYPNTMHHVISAFCGLPHGAFMPNFKIDVQDLP